MLGFLTGVTWSLFCFVVCFVIIEYQVAIDKTIYRKWLYPLFFLKIIFGLLLTFIPGDYIRYIYEINAFSKMEFGLSTEFVKYFYHFLRNFEFDNYYYYFYPSMIFSLLGLIYFYRSLTLIIPSKQNSWWLFLVIFLPGLSFWTAPLGKDGLFLLGNTYFIFNYLKTGRFLGFKQIVGLAIVFIIRPHLLVAIGLGYLLSIILSSQVKPYKRISNVAIAIAVIVLSMPLIISFLRVDIMDLKALSEQIELNSSYGQDGTSYINMTGYPLVYKIFTYLFRPLPYEFVSVAFMLFSFENVMLLILLLPIFKFKNWRFAISKQLALFMLLTGLIIPAILSQAMGNYGLFLRQKWMALPYLLLFVCLVKQNKLQNRFKPEAL